MSKRNTLQDIAVGDAQDQTINITNRRYSLVEKMVDHITRFDYDHVEHHVHELIVDAYNRLLAVQTPSVNVSYGISNESHHWTESVWLNGTDSDERFFSVTVTHVQGMPPPDSNRCATDRLDKIRFAEDKLNTLEFVHPVYQKEILEIFVTFITRLFPTHDVMVDCTDSGWLCMNARMLDGSSTVTILTRSFMMASMETFVSEQRARDHGYMGQTIVYN